MRILCIYPGNPTVQLEGVRAGELPDTMLYGYNHLASFELEADMLGRDDGLPRWFTRGTLGKHLGFRLRHFLLFFTARRYNVVFGGALLYLMPLKKLFGGRAKYVLFNIELLRILRANEHRPLRYRYIVSLLREFAAIVCLSSVQKEWLRIRFPFLEGRLHVVPLGVDVEYCTPVYEGRGNTVLSVGKDGGRDYATLIEAARRMPHTQFEIVCSPRNMTSISDIPPNVRVFYDLPFSELACKYRTAKLIVIETHNDVYADGSDCSGQTVLLDAMAYGLPIIATRKQYLSEYARDGEDLIMVEPYDGVAIQSAIERLEDPMLRLRLARGARSRVERDLSTRQMAERLTRIFHTC